MASGRIPPRREPNRWAIALERRCELGAELLDLTDANPTRTGLPGAGSAEREALAAGAGGRYEPDPRGGQGAREAVADHYARRGLVVSPADIVLTAGTSESYAHLFRLLADPGERVLVPSPGYPLFEPIARLEGVEAAPWRLAWDGAWHLDEAALERAVDGRTRAIVVVQPNHPTGSALDAGEIERLGRWCARHRLAIISDEVFGEFAWDPSRPVASLLAVREVPVFVLGGLSKSCGMPELKLGWIVLAGRTEARAEARAGLEWIADLFLTVSGPVQAAARTLLAVGPAWRARVLDRIAANRESLGAWTARRPELSRLDARAGWTAVVRLPDRFDEEAVALALLERDVIVHPGHFYDLPGSHLVLSLIVDPAVFEAGLARIAGHLAGE